MTIERYTFRKSREGIRLVRMTPADQTANAFIRLAEQLHKLHATLAGCAVLADDLAECVPDYIVQQVEEEIETLRVLADAADEHWPDLQAQLIVAAGKRQLPLPEDDVTYSHALRETAWTTWRRLSLQNQSDPGARIRCYGMLAELLSGFDDSTSWKNHILREFRTLTSLAGLSKKAEPAVTNRQLRAQRKKLIKELGKRTGLIGQWAELLKQCRQDQRIAALNEQLECDLTADIVRNAFR